MKLNGVQVETFAFVFYISDISPVKKRKKSNIKVNHNDV